MKKLLILLSTIVLLIGGCADTISPPLHDAASKGDTAKIQELLNEGKDINEYYYGTPLIWAASEGRLEAVKLLVEKGAALDTRSQIGWTAMGNAAVNGHKEVVEYLIKSGASVDNALAGLKDWTEFCMKPPGVEECVEKNKKAAAMILQMQTQLPTELGWQYFNKGEYQKAALQFENAIKITPSNPDPYVGLAFSYLRLNNPNDAINMAKKAIELSPNNTGAYRALGQAYSAREQYNDAILAGKKAIELSPKIPVLYQDMGLYYEFLKNYNEAINNYKKALELEPNNHAAAFSIMADSLVLGRYDDVIETASRTIALQTITGIGIQVAIQDNYPVVQKQLQNGEIMEGPAKKAGIQAGDKIIKINGEITKGWILEKTIEALRGNEGSQVTLTIERSGVAQPFEKTITREKMIQAASAFPFAIKSMAEREKGDVINADKDADRAYSLNPDEGWAKSAIGISYIGKGLYNEAIQILSTIKNSSFDRCLEATAYAKLGNTQKAADIYISLPESFFSSKSVFSQRYRKAFLDEMKPYVEAKKTAAKGFEEKKQYKEALVEYAEALKVSDTQSEKEIMIKAATIIKAASKLAELPEEARKYSLRGEILKKDGKPDEAIKEINQAIKLAPFVPKLYYDAAFAYGEGKNYTSAIRYANIYLDLYPDAPNAREVKDEIYKWEYRLEKENESKQGSN